MKKTIMKEITFDSAHKLLNPTLTEEQNREVYGKCFGSNEMVAHGHTYKLQVFISGKVDRNGFIMNFVDLKKILNETVVEKYDHKFLNDVLDMITTCENQVDIIWQDISEMLPNNINLTKLILWETPTSCCTLER